jgi:MFS family permease
MNLNSNIWKLFVIQLTQRRYYLPILSIYFLTLSDANAMQIGLWAGAGYLAEFLFEIPSGYISDRIGHKKMLVLAKIFMILAVLSFIHGGFLIFFILGAIFTSLSFASQSGTKTAFLHETLVSLKKESDFIKINTKIAAYASLFSALLLIIIPFSTQISIETPLLIGLFLDVIGLILALLLIKPNIIEKTNNIKSILQLLKEMKEASFLPFAIFTGAITAFLIATKNNYLFPYLENLGFPVIFMGLMLGLLAIVQFLVANNIGKFENNLNIKKVFLFDIVLFSLSFLLIAFLNNFYIISFILIITWGYELGRKPFIDGYLLKNHIHDKNYKATMLSIKGQITMIINFLIVFNIGFFMNHSYKLGFYIMGGILFVILFTLFYFISRKKIE